MAIHLIDRTCELFRYFYAVPSAQDTRGQEIAAVRGVLGSVLSLMYVIGRSLEDKATTNERKQEAAGRASRNE